MPPSDTAPAAPAGDYVPYRADPLVVEHDGSVMLVTIDRPERRNAVDSVCADLLRETFLAFDADEERSVAVLTGSQGNFCAGADLKAMTEGDRRPIPDHGPGNTKPSASDARLNIGSLLASVADKLLENPGNTSTATGWNGES